MPKAFLNRLFIGAAGKGGAIRFVWPALIRDISLILGRQRSVESKLGATSAGGVGHASAFGTKGGVIADNTVSWFVNDGTSHSRGSIGCDNLSTGVVCMARAENAKLIKHWCQRHIL